MREWADKIETSIPAADKQDLIHLPRVEEETEWYGFLVAINKVRQDTAHKGPDLETYDRKQLIGQQEL